jgi:alpha-beta hydrolase superfamily lysophospholipase
VIIESSSVPDFATWLGVDETTKPTGVALIIHGLNCRPSRMIRIANMLVAQGIECLNLSLSGHGCEDDDSSSDRETQDRRRLEVFKSVSRSLWLSEARAAYEIARERADDRGVPLILVGFSLGAAVGSDLASGPRSDICFEGMILFAPAFSVHWYTRFLRFLAPFPRLTLKSLSPKDYAANPGTPIAAYNALFKSIAALRNRQARQRAVDALIFIDPKDELVSYRKLRALCEGPGTGRWTLVDTPKSLRKGRRDYHHLIIDEPSLGSEGWSDVIRHVKQFLAALRV